MIRRRTAEDLDALVEWHDEHAEVVSPVFRSERRLYDFTGVLIQLGILKAKGGK